MLNKETALISSRVEKRIIESKEIVSLINEWKIFEIYTEAAKNATSENLMKAFDQSLPIF